MKIGIIGAGSVGGTLGRGWAATGHEVLFGVRDPAKGQVRERVSQAGSGTRAGSVAEAGAFGEVVVLATPWGAARSALGAAGGLAGKVLVDCTNPLKPDLSGLAVEPCRSGGEMVAAWAPGARVVKAFNTTGAENMADPRYREGRLTMLLAGDDDDAKATVATLAEELGFEAVDAGDLSAARLLEPLALLWIQLAYGQGLGRSFGFRLVRR